MGYAGVDVDTYASISPDCEIKYTIGVMEVEFMMGKHFTLLADEQSLRQLLRVGALALEELQAAR